MTTADFDGGAVDLREWFLPCTDSIDPDKTLREILLDITAEALQAAVENSEAMANFKFDCENPVVSSPGILEITLPLGQEFEGPRWVFDLSLLVKDFIDMRTIQNGQIGEGEDADNVVRLRDYFKGLALEIDEALNRGKEILK